MRYLSARRKIEEADLQMGSLSRKREPRNPVRRRERQDDRSALEAGNSHGTLRAMIDQLELETNDFGLR